jgi:hypothetical protein
MSLSLISYLGMYFSSGVAESSSIDTIIIIQFSIVWPELSTGAQIQLPDLLATDLKNGRCHQYMTMRGATGVAIVSAKGKPLMTCR